MNELDELFNQILGPAPAHAGEGVGDEIWRVLEEAQLTRVGVPAKFGGVDGARSDAATVITRCAQNALAVPLTESLLVAAELAVQTGRELTPGIVTVAFARPGRDAVTATPVDAGWRLSGLVHSVPWADVADTVLLVARIDTDHSLVASLPSGLVDRAATSLAGEPRADLRLAQVEVDASLVSNVVGRDAWALAALGRTCQLLGAMRSCLDLTVSYATLRTQFGRPISGRQVVQHAAVELAGEVAATEAATVAALDQVGEPGEPLRGGALFAIAAAKVQAARAATAIANIAHQLHGAIGLTAEHPLHHFTTRLWCWRGEYGSEREWSLELARMVRTNGDLWQLLTDPSKPAGF